MVNNISQLSGLYSQMAMPAREMRRPDLFSKVDSDGSGGIDQVEISELARKLSEDTGNTLSVEDIFSTYDADGDGQLSKTELDSFMRENAPPPPGGPKPPEAADNTFNVEDIFSTYDTDEDGNWSTAELQNFLLENLSSKVFYGSQGGSTSGLVDQSV
jgi:Ca2+-binding EF-hand superfamily protein